MGDTAQGDAALADAGLGAAARGEAQELGWSLGVLLRAYRQAVTPLVERFPQGARGYEALAEVVRADQPSQLALCARLGLDRTVMTYLIDALEEAGLVERRTNPDDRRQRRIVATPLGRRAVETLCGQMSAAADAVLGELDDRERELFRALLDKAAGANPLVERSGDTCQLVDEVLEDGDGAHRRPA